MFLQDRFHPPMPQTLPLVDLGQVEAIIILAAVKLPMSAGAMALFKLGYDCVEAGDTLQIGPFRFVVLSFDPYTETAVLDLTSE